MNSSTGALTIVGTGTCTITAKAPSNANYNEATDTFELTVNTAGTLTLNVSAIATDNKINIAEKAAGFTISGNTGSEGGVSVSVEVGSTTLTATSSTADPALWSVSVPAVATYITETSVSVAVSASKTGHTAPSDVTRPLAVDLTAPSARTYTAPGSLKVDVAITAMNPSATADTDIDGYSATGLPSGLSINASTGAISGTPDTANASTQAATVTITDNAGNTRTASITFPVVVKGDQTLTGFSYSASQITYGDTAPTVTAPSGDQTALEYSATPSSVCSVNSSTGALTIVGTGTCTITAKAPSNANYNEATDTFELTVNTAGTLTLNVSAIATDNKINIAEKAAGFTISGNTGSEGGVSVSVEVGSTTLTATSSTADPALWSVSVPAVATYITETSVSVAVSASKTGHTAPSDVTRPLAVDLTAPSARTYTAPGSLKVDVAITAMNPSATADTDIDGYSATGLPSGLSINASTGAISGTPDTANASTQAATVTITDNAGNTRTASITFPVVAKGDQTLTGFSYSASQITYGDTAPALMAPRGAQTTIEYSAEPSTVCTVNSNTGALTIVESGTCTITAKAPSNSNYNEATDSFELTVNPAGTLVLNLAVIAGDNTVNIAERAAGFAISGNTGSEGSVSVTVTVGSTELTVTSLTTDPATWSVSVPTAATYISGTSVSVTVSASKTGYTAPSNVSRTLTLDLAAPSARTYTAPPSLKVGVAITAMNPSATTDTDIENYSATGLPSGLSISLSTGAISGTPDTANAGTQAATVTITDTAGNTHTASITFPVVAKGDQTLTGFSYSSSEIVEGDPAPTVTAPTGAETTLEYSAEPSSVCTVASGTGALTIVGTGTCTITAKAPSNTNYNEVTATFELTVRERMAPGAPTDLTAQTNESLAVLGWTAPTDDGDGALDGYNVYRCEEGMTSCTPEWVAWVAIADGTTYSDTGVSKDETYRYAVGASRMSRLSDWSNQVTVTAIAPWPPTELKPTSRSETAIGLGWLAPEDNGGGKVDSYNIYRCEEMAGEEACTPEWYAWQETGTAHTDDDVTAGSTYRYAVKSLRLYSGTGRESLWSEQNHRNGTGTDGSECADGL